MMLAVIVLFAVDIGQLFLIRSYRRMLHEAQDQVMEANRLSQESIATAKYAIDLSKKGRNGSCPPPWIN
jgi:hypothetical protein